MCVLEKKWKAERSMLNTGNENTNGWLERVFRIEVLLWETIERRMKVTAFWGRVYVCWVTLHHASSAKYLEVKGQQKIKKDGEV